MHVKDKKMICPKNIILPPEVRHGHLRTNQEDYIICKIYTNETSEPGALILTCHDLIS